MTVETGYEGEDTIDEQEKVTYLLEKYLQLHTGLGITCRVLMNGKPVGMLNVQNDEHFEWLKARIDGTFDPELEI